MIEYFGLTGDEKYDKKTSEKIILAERHRIELFAIYPADLADLNSKLGILRERRASPEENNTNTLTQVDGETTNTFTPLESAPLSIRRETDHDLSGLANEKKTRSTTGKQSRRQAEENGIPVRWIEGYRLQQADSDLEKRLERGALIKARGGEGKALYRGQDGWAITIEQIALESYSHQDYKGKWTENQYWWGIMSMLFWDVIYARLHGVFSNEWPFPSRMQDIPHDFFSKDFYTRRKDLIDRRIKQLTEPSLFGFRKPNIEAELRRSFQRYHNLLGRPAAWTKNFDENDFAAAAKALTEEQLLTILHRLLEDFGRNRTGLPDLFLVRSGVPLFVEVKSEPERLKSDQITWLQFLQNELRIQVEICRVIEKED